MPPVASLFVVLRAATPSSQLTVTLLRLGDLPPGWIADSSSGGGGGSGSSDVLCGILAGTRFPDPLGGAEAEFASSIALGSLSGAYAVVHSVAVFSRANADATMAQYRGAFATCSGATFDLDGTLFTMTAEPVALTLPRGSTVAVRLILGPPIALDIVAYPGRGPGLVPACRPFQAGAVGVYDATGHGGGIQVVTARVRCRSQGGSRSGVIAAVVTLPRPRGSAVKIGRTVWCGRRCAS